MEEMECEWTEKKGGKRTAAVKFPSYCRITVQRRHPTGHIASYTAEVYWEEAYAQISRFDDTPNEMWRKRPRGQLAKCTEAAALRIAFPEEVGNDLTAEEMEGQMIDISNGQLVNDHQEPVKDAPPAPTMASFQDNAEDVTPAPDEPQEADAGSEDPAPEPSEEERYVAQAMEEMEQIDSSEMLQRWWQSEALVRADFGLEDGHPLFAELDRAYDARMEQLLNDGQSE